MSDEDARALDRAAELDALVAREYPSILALGLALLRNIDDARDLAQDTMLRLQRNWREVRRLDRPGAWCRRVAINAANDMLRQRSRRSRLARRLGQQPLAIVEIEGWDVDFWSSVARLPERQRSVVVLHYVGDLSVQDIAESLDVPVGTVKSDLARARSTLRRTLGRGSDDA